MKYLKRFNESQNFCGECGKRTNPSDLFCAECGSKTENASTFTIKGRIEKSFPNGQKTPDLTLSSLNKTLSGTPIILNRNINIYDLPFDKEVSITGTTKNGESPSWKNPIIVDKIEDIK